MTSHRLPDRALAALSVPTVPLPVLFTGVPGHDLGASFLVHTEANGFLLRATAVLAAVDRFFRSLAMVTVVGFLVPVHISLATGGRLPFLRSRHIMSVVLVFAIGPGLLVRGALENRTGRVRAKTIVRCGGEGPFSPACVPGNSVSETVPSSLETWPSSPPFSPRCCFLRWPVRTVAAVKPAVLAGFHHVVNGIRFPGNVVQAALMTWILALAVCGLLRKSER